MRKKVRNTIFVFTLASLLAGCVNETGEWYAGNQSLLALKLSLPHNAESGETRAITPATGEENQIETIDILALTEQNGKWVYDYAATQINRETDGNELIITVSVRELPTPQQFVIIANGAAELHNAAPTRGEHIDVIENRLISTGWGEWPARNNNTGDFKPFPMYARTPQHTIQASGNNLIDNVALIRMVARIEVTLKSDITNFILEEACLFNYKTAGYVSNGVSERAVSKPAVPPHQGNPTEEIILEPTVMYASNKSDDSRGAIRSAIYTYESPAITTEEERLTGTALVVGGYYNGETQHKSYYRIDLKTTTDPETSNISSALLRNHSYLVQIQRVTGNGYPTAKEAYIGSARLSTVIRDWNLIEQHVSDKQYYLNVSESSVKLESSLTSTCTITAKTNYDNAYPGLPVGIHVDEITYSTDGTSYAPAATSADNWLAVNKTGNNTDASLVFSAPKETTFIGNRFAKVKVSAGNFAKYIYVSQAKLPALPPPTQDIGGGTPPSDNTYIGAFWRHNQRGERLIRIPVTEQTKGKWAVQVLDRGEFVEGDILFDKANTSDTGVTWTVGNETHTDPDDGEFFVDNGEANIMGDAPNVTDYIYFRIGLRNTIAANEHRYARIIISYANFTRNLVLFLRQGDAPDLLIPPDNDTRNLTEAQKKLVKKYSPYNLTANSIFENEAGFDNLGPGLGTFVKYPSQAGAYFKWANAAGSECRAWHPSNPSISGATNYNTSASWSSSLESCPSNYNGLTYRRPKTSTTSTTSEVALSLMSKLSNITTISGYLADGFFDRLVIRDVTSNKTITQCAVAIGTAKIAYIGSLYYHGNRSLFFTNAGSIYIGTPPQLPWKFYNQGGLGWYWTSSINSSTISYYYTYSSSSGSLDFSNTGGRGLPISIRCVVDE